MLKVVPSHFASEEHGGFLHLTDRKVGDDVARGRDEMEAWVEVGAFGHVRVGS